jgi:hypothetical protein
MGKRKTIRKNMNGGGNAIFKKKPPSKPPKPRNVNSLHSLREKHLAEIIAKLDNLQILIFENLERKYNNKIYLHSFTTYKPSHSITIDLNIYESKFIDLVMENHLEMKYILTLRNRFNDILCTIAACKGNMDTLKWGHKNFFPFGDICSTAAAGHGHLHCLEYIHQTGGYWNGETCSYSAENGHLHCLKYAHENGCPWDTTTCEMAAYNGNIDCIQYARDNGCPWDKETCETAAKRGQLLALQYAHENGCPWDETTCAVASANNQLYCLKYAHENGCPWDENTVLEAADNSNSDCFIYAIKNGCPCDIDYIIDILKIGMEDKTDEEQYEESRKMYEFLFNNMKNVVKIRRRPVTMQEKPLTLRTITSTRLPSQPKTLKTTKHFRRTIRSKK